MNDFRIITNKYVFFPRRNNDSRVVNRPENRELKNRRDSDRNRDRNRHRDRDQDQRQERDEKRKDVDRKPKSDQRKKQIKIKKVCTHCVQCSLMTRLRSVVVVSYTLKSNYFKKQRFSSSFLLT